MTGDKVHHRVEVFFRIVLAEAFHTPHTKFAVNVAKNKVKDMRPQRIIHRRIHFIAAEVLTLHAVSNFIRRVLPDLTNHHGIGIEFLKLRKEQATKFGGQLIDNIKTPAANALACPML